MFYAAELHCRALITVLAVFLLLPFLHFLALLLYKMRQGVAGLLYPPPPPDTELQMVEGNLSLLTTER